MKRFIALVFALFALICMLAVTGCSVSWTEEEIKHAKSVEITCYDNHGSSDAVEIYTITDEKEVNSICNTFSLLVVKKAKITEPTMMSYSVRFLDGSGNTIETVNLLYGHNVIQYKITGEMDINRYIRLNVLNGLQN